MTFCVVCPPFWPYFSYSIRLCLIQFLFSCNLSSFSTTFVVCLRMFIVGLPPSLFVNPMFVCWPPMFICLPPMCVCWPLMSVCLPPLHVCYLPSILTVCVDPPCLSVYLPFWYVPPSHHCCVLQPTS